MTMPFVIVPTLSLRAGLLMSAFLAAATIPSAVLASLVGRKIPPLFSLPFYGAVSTGCVLLLRFCVSGQALLLEDLGVYVPLAAFNGMMLELALVHPRRRASDALHDAVMAFIPETGLKNGQVLWPLRIAISGLASTPGGAFEIACLLGREETLRRLDRSLAKL